MATLSVERSTSPSGVEVEASTVMGDSLLDAMGDWFVDDVLQPRVNKKISKVNVIRILSPMSRLMIA